MKRIAVFLSVVVLFFSCANQFYTEFQDGSDSKLNDIIFPEPQPFQPEPIAVSGFQASNGDFLDEIEIKWNPVSAGVWYWRLFWFTDEEEARAALTEASTNGFYKTEETVGVQNSGKLSFTASSYTHSFTFDGDGSEIQLSSDMTFYYLLKGYDGAERIIAYSTVAEGKTATVPYDVTASRNYQPQTSDASAFITLTWKWDAPGASFCLERAKAPYSQEQSWDDLGVIDAAYGDGVYTYVEEFSHLDGCVVGKEAEEAGNVRCLPECPVGAEFAYRIYAVTNGVESSASRMVQGATVKWGTPPAVTGVTASRGLYGKKIVLTWDALDVENFEDYSLYVQESANSQFTLVEKNLTEPRYEYTTTSFNIMNFYVRAANQFGEGVPSDTVSGNIIPQVRNTAGTLLTDETAITVTWSPVAVVDGAIVYNLYRSETTAGEGTLIAENLTGTTYSDSDETLQQGKVYYYSIEPRNTAAVPPEEGIGQRSAFKNTYGVTGTMPQPEFTVSTGESDIKLTLSNKPAYCCTTVNVERWVYTPNYTKKASADASIPSQPQNWQQTLQFKNRWTRSKKESVAVEKSTDVVIVDPSSSFGYNDYTVYYVFEIPEISFSINSEASVKKSGYRQISDEEFLINALRVIDFSQSWLNLIHQSGMGANGFDSVSINGYNGWSSGNCGGKGGSCSSKESSPNKGCFHYNVSIGSPITVPLMYNDFEAFDMTFNSIRTGHQTEVDINANGKLVGYINISGLYPGKLTFDLTIASSVKAGGTYTVQQEGKKSATSLAWDTDRAYFRK